MAFAPKLLFFTVVLLAAAGILPSMASPPPPSLSLAERLQLAESSNCLSSMLEIHSCIGEIVMLLLNGETYIGPGCCAAVETIVHDCRPSMLDWLGFTAEEGHVLDEYCQGAADIIPPSPPPAPPSLFH
ncbi:egg cell-secreted protein 1.1-like [Diospyros lotus]|uniref:egg cell-secreted protein 1.1-like n=1 Tax=Diospyros lotus TaxID=55363 RepID=UPI0022568BD6|nr:egg cell-secreted protein 1.1-like [Diospyros lotus]